MVSFVRCWKHNNYIQYAPSAPDDSFAATVVRGVMEPSSSGAIRKA